jgi:hypothetical protein
MPNAIAYIALLLWPVVTLALFASMRPAPALIWSLLGGYLLLPVNTAFDFPGVPALDKTSIPSISALVGALIFAKGPVARLPREWWLMALMALYVISPIFTVLTNRDHLMFGSIILPGLKPYDAFSAAAYKCIDVIPFILGYNMLRNTRAQDYFLRALVVAVLGYTLLMLIEVRLSPQLHTWIYGFFPHSFGQQVRSGGYRPVVFLGHGLLVAILTAMTIVATAYLARRRATILGVSAWAWLAYLLAIMILCRSLGALVLAGAALLAMTVIPRKGVRLICALMAITVLAYPVLRGVDLVPVQALAEQIAMVNEERAESFQTRIDNENRLLERAGKRPWFGWGGFGRNRVYDEYTGRDLSITDGTWVIIIGSNGWAGYVAAFGLLCLPMVAVWRRGAQLSSASTALSLILAVNLLDLLPNSSLTPLTWLMAGTLARMPRRSGRKNSNLTSHREQPDGAHLV